MQNNTSNEIKCNDLASDVSELTEDFYPQQQITIIEPVNEATLRAFPIRSSYLAKKKQSGTTEEINEGEDEGSDHVMATPRRYEGSEEESLCCLCVATYDVLSSCCSMLNICRTSQTLIIPTLTNQNPDVP